METKKVSGEQKRYVITDGFIIREIAGETTIIPADPDCDITNGVLLPNGSAAFIWNIFQNPSTKEEAVLRILQEFDVQKETAEDAVQRFINDLFKYRILKEVEL